MFFSNSDQVSYVFIQLCVSLWHGKEEMGNETLASLHKILTGVGTDCPAMNGTHCFKTFKDYDFFKF